MVAGGVLRRRRRDGRILRRVSTGATWSCPRRNRRRSLGTATRSRSPLDQSGHDGTPGIASVADIMLPSDGKHVSRNARSAPIAPSSPRCPSPTSRAQATRPTRRPPQDRVRRLAPLRALQLQLLAAGRGDERGFCPAACFRSSLASGGATTAGWFGLARLVTTAGPASGAASCFFRGGGL
jgi:hypothetical protein